MMILDIDKSNARYERKFRIECLSKEEVEANIKSNTAFFKEIFHERIVNNVYFDSDDFIHYCGNVEGDRQRFKVRIRWYGKLKKFVEKPRLELKIKDGLLGSKLSFPLNAFEFKEGVSMAALFENVFSESDLPMWVKEYLKKTRPSLLNNYRRKYFISSGKDYRITIDYDLRYYYLSSGTFFLNNFERDDALVVELKYGKEYDGEAAFISNQFPFRLTKSSKYVNGIDVLSEL